MNKQLFPTALLGLALGAVPAAADVWDVQPSGDDSIYTVRNELVHGTEQVHDLATRPGPVADVDYYAIGQKPYSSYEVVVDSGSGAFGGSGPYVLLTGGFSVVHTSRPVSPGRENARSLRWANTTSSVENLVYVRVASTDCGLTCDASDQYHIRSYETTTAIARFNNSATQVTILLLQNPTEYAVAGTVYYWSGAGTLIASAPLALAPKGLAVIPTAGPAPGVSGSITIAHDARYGDLNGKAVALEPATGFSFDSPMVHRPR